MKRSALAALLVCSCNVNVEALEDHLGALGSELVAKETYLEQVRRVPQDLAMLDTLLADALDGGSPRVPPRVEVAPPSGLGVPPLPVKSMFEGSRARTLRARIADTRAQLLAVDADLAAVKPLEARTREVRDKTERLDALLKKKAAPEP